MNRSSSSSKVRAIFRAVLSAATVLSLVAFVGCVPVEDDEDDDGVNPGGGGGGGSGWSQSTALTLSGNSSEWTREFTSSRQEAWFKFEANGKYVIDIRDRYYRATGATQSNYTVDARISVMDEDLNFIRTAYHYELVNRWDEGGNDDHELIFTDLVGTHYVKIEPYSAGGEGSFYLSITKEGGVTDGEDMDNAIDITELPAASYELELTSSRPSRWFMFEADGRYKVTIRDRFYRATGATSSPYSVDARITVMDEYGDYVKSAYHYELVNRWDEGGNDDSEIIFTDLEGIYYIRIDPYSENGFGSFFVDIENEGPVTAGEDADNAIEISDRRYTKNELTSSRPERWFYFVASSSTETLNVFDRYYNPTNATVEKPTVDLRVTVMDDYFDYVNDIVNRDIGNNENGVINLTGLDVGEEYFVKISPYSENGFGSFYIWLD